MTKKKTTRQERRLAKRAAKEKSNKKPRIPRQQRLPGTEDAKITKIHNAALDYAEIRDQRQDLTKSEVECKQKLIDLMHEFGKEEYIYNGVTVKLVHESETVKVRVKDEDDLPSPATDVTVGELAEG